MKRMLQSLILFMLFSVQSVGQLPNGSIAPDFTMKDINGNTVHLYDYLDSGKSVIIDFFEVMCAPCWRYHETHSLAKAYNAWGPGGTDQLRVLEIEGIKSTVNQIRGLEQPTYGDWTAGEPFPFIATCEPNTDKVIVDYKVGYYPTVYMICRDRRVKLIGAADTAVIHANLDQCPSAPADSLYLDLVKVDSMKYVTCNNYINLFLQFQNYGIKDISSVKIGLDLDHVLRDTISWTGNLKTYDVLNVDGKLLNQLGDGSHLLTYVITELNGSATGFRKDTLTVRFTVMNSWQQVPFSEDFNQSGFPYNKWTVRNYYSYLPTWERAELGYGNALRVPFYNIPENFTSSLFLPGLSFTNSDRPQLRFDIACAHNNSVIRQAGYDYVSIDYSANCGKSFVNIAGISALDNLTAPDDSTFFVPKADQWKPVVIDLSKLAYTDNILMVFSSQSVHGNNMYFRNIRIENSSSTADESSLGEICLFPMPVKDVLRLRLKNKAGTALLELLDSEGRQLWSDRISVIDDIRIPMDNFDPGIYFLRIVTDLSTTTRKVIKW